MVTNMSIKLPDISKANIKLVSSLHKSKYRDEKRLFFAEGIKLVNEALMTCKDNIEFIVVDEAFVGANKNLIFINELMGLGINIYSANSKIFSSLSDTATPQGIMAIIKMFDYQDNKMFDGDFYVMPDAVQDPGNIGTIIRTADAANVDGIIVTEGCADIYNPKVVRASMGSIFHIPVYFCKDLAHTIERYKQNRFRIVTGHLAGKTYYFEQDFTDKIVVVVGNESQGVSTKVEELSDVLVKIPLPGKAESLNVSVATAILMFEVVRQRLIKLK